MRRPAPISCSKSSSTAGAAQPRAAVPGNHDFGGDAGYPVPNEEGDGSPERPGGRGPAERVVQDRGFVMPVRKFRSVEEMSCNLWYAPGVEELRSGRRDENEGPRNAPH